MTNEKLRELSEKADEILKKRAEKEREETEKREKLVERVALLLKIKETKLFTPSPPSEFDFLLYRLFGKKPKCPICHKKRALLLQVVQWPIDKMREHKGYIYTYYYKCENCDYECVERII